MLNPDEFAKIVDMLFEELSGIAVRDCRSATETVLPLRTEVDEALKFLCYPKVKREEVVSTCFGVVDEFVRAPRDDFIEELHREYVSTHTRT